MFEPRVEAIRLELVNDTRQLWAGAGESRGALLVAFEAGLHPFDQPTQSSLAWLGGANSPPQQTRIWSRSRYGFSAVVD